MKKNIERMLVLASAVTALSGLLWGCGGTEKAIRGETAVSEGIGQGYRGPILVQVEAEDGLIVDLKVLEDGEDPFVGGEALDRMVEEVLETGSTDVDVVSGATETSRGFLEAVEDALQKGGK